VKKEFYENSNIADASEKALNFKLSKVDEGARVNEMFRTFIHI
jgi:hypothetical protein